MPDIGMFAFLFKCCNIIHCMYSHITVDMLKFGYLFSSLKMAYYTLFFLKETSKKIPAATLLIDIFNHITATIIPPKSENITAMSMKCSILFISEIECCIKIPTVENCQHMAQHSSQLYKLREQRTEISLPMKMTTWLLICHLMKHCGVQIF